MACQTGLTVDTAAIYVTTMSNNGSKHSRGGGTTLSNTTVGEGAHWNKSLIP